MSRASQIEMLKSALRGDSNDEMSSKIEHYLIHNDSINIEKVIYLVTEAGINMSQFRILINTYILYTSKMIDIDEFISCTRDVLNDNQVKRITDSRSASY